MRILLIDDEDLILEFLRVCLEDALPGVEITEYPSKERGRPAADFDWSAYDLLLLDYNLGNGENGVEWLQAFGERPDFPRTVLITAVNDPYVVAQAVKSGADGYLNKADMTPARLVETVKDVMEGPLADSASIKPEGISASAARDGSQAQDAPAAATIEPTAALEEIADGASYRFGRCIGEGAMSRVYLAERSTDGHTVVIKILDRKLAKNEEFVSRFRLEGALVSGIDSPYVVKIYDRGITNSYDYIVMEFFGRGDLKQQMEHGITASQAVNFLHDIAHGLRAIHAVDIVHRDLKPANIMFRADGSMALADFGIAKRLDTDLSLTEPGGILGTLNYMSPEQAKAEKADKRSDIYTAGVIFYEMLTGKRPYLGRSVSAMLMHHIHGPIPVLPGDLVRYQPLLDGTMSKDIDKRFQNADELLDALRVYNAAGSAV